MKKNEASKLTIPFSQAEFLCSSPSAKSWPKLDMPEIAFCGRSNVGKSTLINALLRRKKLAKVSSTPGKTQGLNFFIVDEALALVDLPGYGYAAVPDKVRASWGKMIDEYLTKRGALRLLLLLFDIRRTPNEHDMALIEWAQANDFPTLAILTKVDKLKKSARKAQKEKVLAKLGIEEEHSVCFSAPKKIGRETLIRKINTMLNHYGTS